MSLPPPQPDPSSKIKMPHTVVTASDTNNAAAAANGEDTAFPPEQAADAIIGVRESAASSGNEDAAASGLATNDDTAGVKEAGEENMNADDENVKRGERGTYGVNEASVEKLNEQEAHGVVQRYLEAMENTSAASNIMGEKQQEKWEHEDRQPKAKAAAAVCRCLKSTCILLYCPCFGNGQACKDTCYCKSCKNPVGVNKNSEQRPPAELGFKMKRELREASVKFGIAMGRELLDDIKDASDDREDSAVNGLSSSTSGQRMKRLTVSPGRLGISLAIGPEGGARIMGIDPACTFKEHVQVGDRIITIDGKRVITMDDVKANRDRMRRFGIVRKVAASDNTAATAKQVSKADNVAIASAKRALAASDNAATTTALHASSSPTKKRTTMTSVVAELNKEIAQLREHIRKLEVEGTPEMERLRVENEKLCFEVDELKGALQREIMQRKELPKRHPRGSLQTFPFLEHLNANSDSRDADQRREDLLRELLQYDKKNDKDTALRMGSVSYQVLCVPTKRRSTVDKPELNNKCFHKYNKHSKLFDKFLNAWAQYVSGSQEDAADMILLYMSKRFPTCYVKNFDTATKKTEKIIGPKPPELPPDFVSYDDTNDVKWNTMYAELVKYKEEHGDCNCKCSSNATSLGKWVSGQRSAKRKGFTSLSDKRVELLNELGFVWEVRPEHHMRAIPGGDPRANRAIAAKLVYPDLTMREALYLGGFEEEELNVCHDPKYTWRTVYVFHKDRIRKYLAKYETARRTGRRLEVEKLANILRSDDEGRFQQVFGEKCELVPHYLEAAEERRRNGITEEPLKKKQRREKEDDQQEQEEVYESEDNGVGQQLLAHAAQHEYTNNRGGMRWWR